MTNSVTAGYLLLADITGYTAYLSRSEIEHAPTIAGDLLETVVGRLEPPFRLAKLEGDAAFLFVEDGRAEPSLLLDATVAAYVAFRRRLRSIEGATSCDCNACGLAPRLGLKMFLHYGSFVHTRVAGRDELAGSDVILIHRLLKGVTATRFGGRGFALMTLDAITALGIAPTALGLESTQEWIDDIGDVKAHVLDLDRSWHQESRRRRIGQADTRPILELVAELPVEPAVAWAHLTSPSLRNLWEGPISVAVVDGDDPSTTRINGPGTVTQCITGRLASIEEIVDWQPYDHVGWRVIRPGVGPLDSVVDIKPSQAGTQVQLRWCVAIDTSPPESEVRRLRDEKSSAIDRLAQRLSADRRPTQPA